MLSPKSHIRKSVLINRKKLSNELVELRSKEVCDRAASFIEEAGFPQIHIFLPIVKNKEVNTWPLIKSLTLRQKEVVVSATDFEAEKMTHFLYSQTLKFEDDAFGIPTPVCKEAITLDRVDAVLIPLLAADKKGNRVGYGKGYYDRLLLEMPQNVKKIGLSLGPSFDLFSFVEPQDVPMDYLITPIELINCTHA
jgi:5-formyltetrahydrofolate cyclo-ligase